MKSPFIKIFALFVLFLLLIVVIGLFASKESNGGSGNLVNSTNNVKDTDGDGAPNWLETLSGTDINDPNSFPEKKEDPQDEFEVPIGSHAKSFRAASYIVDAIDEDGNIDIEKAQASLNELARIEIVESLQSVDPFKKRVNLQPNADAREFKLFFLVSLSKFKDIKETETILKALGGDSSPEIQIGLQNIIFTYEEVINTLLEIPVPTEYAAPLQKIISIFHEHRELTKKSLENIDISTLSALLYAQKTNQIELLNLYLEILR